MLGFFSSNILKTKKKEILFKKINVIGSNLSPEQEYIYRLGYNKGYNTYLFQISSSKQVFYISENGKRSEMKPDIFQPEFQEFFTNGYVDGYHKSTEEN